MRVFSSQYAPSIEYLSYLQSNKKICIDIFENFQKQSFRNRTKILGPNGPQTLVVPVISGKKMMKKRMKDTLIDNTQGWRKNHWKSLEAAYRRSPYFEFYEDMFRPILLEGKHKYLVDMNKELLDVILELTDTAVEIEYSKEYINVNQLPSRTFYDGRIISSKKHTSYETTLFKYYNQVFLKSENAFVENLSVLDILFNEGPNSKNYYPILEC